MNSTGFKNPLDIAVTLTMLTIPILNTHKRGSLNILFSFESEAGYSTVLADASQLLLVPGIHANYTCSSAVTSQFVTEHNTDRIVSNFKQRNEEKLDCRIIQPS